MAHRPRRAVAAYPPRILSGIDAPGRVYYVRRTVPVQAPVRIPVELVRSDARWFRLACAVGTDGLELSSAVPDELDGPLELRFQLPGDTQPIACRGRAEERVVGDGGDERAERRALRFLDLDEAQRARLQTYLQERLGLTA